MSESQTNTSPLYRSFKLIEGESYRSILRFVEDHSTDISLLPIREYFELQYAYVAALFETGGHARVVELTHELLELSIVHSLIHVDGEDAFRTLLFRRASSLFHLMRYEQCLHVCDQLIRLHPDFAAATLLYEKALYQRPNKWVTRARAFSVFLFLAAATLIAAEVLVLDYILDTKVDRNFAHLRNGCFIIGWCLLLFGDIGHRSWAWLRVKSRANQYAHVRRNRK